MGLPERCGVDDTSAGDGGGLEDTEVEDEASGI